ncbi:MAG: UDP-N-acetyl-D-mannosaminuronic acid dehydrogenase [Candidatus Peregrinibacteria bacterium Greene0416_62]|nr:MAG: UDP-N-acetyl-D-mannosaminuronic acid dehydrogenase [Candidatus Peregrinibacteria bacterium Greene0416_62]TSC98590.1 MAG: UDP-N-acetyl-D-mannosaminuronic acid dehydrogenase [Candidatus Peregrinibacteria bacterium Greene1014_49]
MHKRLAAITVSPKESIHKAMEKIDAAPRQNPPAPTGIILVTQKGKFLGIATDGDIRNAILEGKDLQEPIESIMIKRPLTVLHAESADTILARFHDVLRERDLPESRFHHILTVDEVGNLVDIFSPFELWRRSEVKIKTVSVIGLGYVGLTLALTLNEFGIRVIGVDINEKVIKKLKGGVPHFYEKGLDQLIKKHANKNLILSSSLSENQSDIFVICVGTPVSDKGKVMSAYLTDAVREVGKVLKPHDLVILRSTVPIGTCRGTVIPLLEKVSGLKAGETFMVSFAPERTVEGKALEELRTLPQIIGGVNRQSLDETSKFFRVFAHTIVAVDNLEEAEAVKLLNNTFRDVSFGFANEVAWSLHGYGLNARKVIRAANEGYGRNPIPAPSPGVGGMCLVKDPYLFVASAKEKGYHPRLPIIARDINVSMIKFIADQVDAFLKKHKKNPAKARLFLAGMAFKGSPETSDLRYSTSVEILEQLRKRYKQIAIFDPVASEEDLGALNANVVRSLKEGFKDSDCVLMLNNHPSFREADIFALASTMKAPGFLFDPWGSYREEQLTGVEGIHYAGL